MKLKMLQAPRMGQKDMVCNTAHGTFIAELGGVIEIKDEAGAEILAQWPGCFQQVLDSAKASPAKATPEEKAEAEAAKMAHGYQNKKAEVRI